MDKDSHDAIQFAVTNGKFVVVDVMKTLSSNPRLEIGAIVKIDGSGQCLYANRDCLNKSRRRTFK
jgi:hypothetical protein